MKKLLSLLLCLQILILPAMAQEGEGGENSDFVKNTQMDMIVVAGATGAGAILGLSTLSFVDDPSRHLRNVWTGAAIGLIAGVCFVAYNSAQRGTEDLQSSKDFNTSERASWHFAKAQNLTMPEVQFGTQFWQMNF